MGGFINQGSTPHENTIFAIKELLCITVILNFTNGTWGIGSRKLRFVNAPLFHPKKTFTTKKLKL